MRVAAEDKSFAVNRRLFRALSNVELFFPLEIAQHGDSEEKATPLLRLPDGTHAMMLYTTKSHPDLPDRFGGGRLEDALAAALKMPGLDWVIVSNRASHWVAVNKKQIAAVLDDLNSGENEVDASSAISESGPRDGVLEELITQAVHSTPERLSPPIGSVLQGHEIYLELNAEKSQAGQLVMKIFVVEHMTNVVRAYLTRSRSGITYGGIKWDALKDMLRKDSKIQGIQLINDADDWVIFDRESLGLSRDDG